MKNKFSLIVSVVLLVVLSAVCGTSVYAWLCVSDNASQMQFQLARINSVVYFYTARDFDFNGIPDLISADDHPAANPDEQHDLYYGERRYFNYVNKREAVAEGTQGDLAKPVDINNFAIHVAPTKIYTAKLSLVNKSDSANDVSITLPLSTLSNKQAQMYSTLKIRVCRMVNTTADMNALPMVEVGEWHYLCDSATASGSEILFDETKVTEDFSLSGMDEQLKAENKDKVVNTADLWLQVSMATYDELSAKEKFAALSVTKDDYQSLQGLTAAFNLAFTVLFQVNLNTLTGN